MLLPGRLATFGARGHFSPLAAWRERRFAAECCRRLLGLCQRIAADHPELTGVALYLKVVAAHLGGDAAVARRVIEGAEESYASWPVERALKFRDVVHYLAVVGYCHGNGVAVSTDVRPVIDAVIPHAL
jgi:hypothetical protein